MVHNAETGKQETQIKCFFSVLILNNTQNAVFHMLKMQKRETTQRTKFFSLLFTVFCSETVLITHMHICTNLINVNLNMLKIKLYFNFFFFFFASLPLVAASSSSFPVAALILFFPRGVFAYQFYRYTKKFIKMPQKC